MPQTIRLTVPGALAVDQHLARLHDDGVGHGRIRDRDARDVEVDVKDHRRSSGRQRHPFAAPALTAGPERPQVPTGRRRSLSADRRGPADQAEAQHGERRHPPPHANVVNDLLFGTLCRANGFNGALGRQPAFPTSPAVRRCGRGATVFIGAGAGSA